MLVHVKRKNNPCATCCCCQRGALAMANATNTSPQEAQADQLTSAARSSLPTSDARETPSSHETPSFVAPSDYLRPRALENTNESKAASKPMGPIDREQVEGLVSLCLHHFTIILLELRRHLCATEANGISLMQRAIRAFLKVRRSYDVLPLSFRLIILDTALLVKKSLNILIQNGWSGRITSLMLKSLKYYRHRLCTTMGLENFNLCWSAHGFRLYQRRSILLAKPGRTGSDRPVQAEQSARYRAMSRLVRGLD